MPSANAILNCVCTWHFCFFSSRAFQWKIGTESKNRSVIVFYACYVNLYISYKYLFIPICIIRNRLYFVIHRHIYLFIYLFIMMRKKGTLSLIQVINKTQWYQGYITLICRCANYFHRTLLLGYWRRWKHWAVDCSEKWTSAEFCRCSFSFWNYCLQ